MKIKALFFDIDGTLVSFTTHRIPESTIEALREAHRRGVRIFISTGRPPAIINNIGEIAPLVDGMVTVNGALCFVGDRVVAADAIPKDRVEAVLKAVDKLNVPCVLVGERKLALYNPQEYAVEIFRNMLDVADIGQNNDPAEVLASGVLQLTPFITESEEADVLPLLTGVETGRWCHYFMDITAPGVCKARGMEEIARHCGFSLEESMGFGDGGNDISMLQAAGIGVAMGNANDEVKSCADYVTTSVDDHGVANALRHFGVI